MHKLPTRASAGALVLALLLALGACVPAPRAAAPTAAPPNGFDAIPLLAYYYIWFDESSWSRAKTDLPQLGRYSSDDPAVMRQHLAWAKAAGIGGFIVSWKSTPTLNRRLAQLIQLANAEQFKLLIIYQGLDFYRNPLPIDRIASDLDDFLSQFASAEPFYLFDRPVVIWSGTWKFSPEEIEQVAGPRRARLRILASERSTEAYARLAGLVDGNAYYWSSVDPTTFPNYPARLAEMGAAVHAGGGLWIAPAAVGFDARLIGGTRVVDRKDGQTLQLQLNAALGSSPDALGLISWNEFSENSYLEPSQAYGQRYIERLAAMRGAACGSAPPPELSIPWCVYLPATAR